MSKLDSRAWPCIEQANKCPGILGNIVGGEISINLQDVSIVNTDGVNLVLTCKFCGKPKTWFCKDSAVVNAFYKMMVDGIANALIKAQRRRTDAEN